MDAIYLSLLLPIIVLIVVTKLIFSSPSNNTDDKRGRRELNLPPSPPSLPIIGHLHLVKKPLHRSLAALSARHGPLLRLRFGQRPVLLVSSAELAADCFSRNDLAFATRACFPSARRLSYDYSTIASAPYGPHWRNLRRISALHLFSPGRLLSFSAARATEVHSLLSTLFRESGARPAKLRLRPRLFEVALNVIMVMVAGKRYYGPDSARRFREMMEAVLALIGASNVGDFIPLLGVVDFQGVNRRMAMAHKMCDEMLQRHIEEHKREGCSDKTLIGELLSMQAEQPEDYTDKNIKALIMTLLFAGTDTTTVTVEWAMSYLLNNPPAMAKLRQEIDGCVGEGQLLEERHLSELPYLQAVLTETLRLCPAAPMLVPHEARQDVDVGGYHVPRGTMLLVNLWAIQRDPSNWVEPERFMPERFAGVGVGVGVGIGGGDGDGRMMPFGMGRRRCPGEGLATRVAGLELGTLVQCFEWGRVGDEEVDMSERAGLTFLKARPLEAMYKPRERMVHVLSQM